MFDKCRRIWLSKIWLSKFPNNFKPAYTKNQPTQKTKARDMSRLLHVHVYYIYYNYNYIQLHALQMHCK